MFYTFPVIQTLEDVLPSIEGCGEIGVYPKDGGFTTVVYNVAFGETFLELDDPRAAIRRECRGLIFDTKTGKILRRPYHKFFNVNERPETGEDVVSPRIFDTNHVFMRKLDGSMIAPFIIPETGEVCWGTKSGRSAQEDQCRQFVESSGTSYEKFVRTYLTNGFTPIFEWMSPQNRIVLNYGDTSTLVLTAIRDMITGEYLTYKEQGWFIERMHIPHIMDDDVSMKDTLKEIIEDIRLREDEEGHVLRFGNGHMVKFKTEWYVGLHRVKDNLTRERDVINYILTGEIDDMKSLCTPEDLAKIEKYEHAFKQRVSAIVEDTWKAMQRLYGHVDRKTFAQSGHDDLHEFQVNFLFRNWSDSCGDKSQYLTKIQEDFYHYLFTRILSNGMFRKVQPFLGLNWNIQSVEE